MKEGLVEDIAGVYWRLGGGTPLPMDWQVHSMSSPSIQGPASVDCARSWRASLRSELHPSQCPSSPVVWALHRAATVAAQPVEALFAEGAWLGRGWFCWVQRLVQR